MVLSAPWKARLYAWGLVPTITLNWPRKLARDLKPTWRAMRSVQRKNRHRVHGNKVLY
jgi:hypothetical protein